MQNEKYLNKLFELSEYFYSQEKDNYRSEAEIKALENARNAIDNAGLGLHRPDWYRKTDDRGG